MALAVWVDVIEGLKLLSQVVLRSRDGQSDEALPLRILCCRVQPLQLALHACLEDRELLA